MTMMTSFRLAAYRLVWPALFVLVNGCEKADPPAKDVAYSVTGTVHDLDGSLFEASRVDILYKDYSQTKTFNGGSYVLGARLSVDGKGSFSGSFTAPVLACDLNSFDFLLIKNDSVSHQIIQRAVLGSASRVVCDNGSPTAQQITFDLMTQLP